MATSWKPARLGRITANWVVELIGDKLVVTIDDASEHLPLAQLGRVRIRRGLVTSSIEWGAPTQLKLKGLSPRDARDLRATVESERERVLASIRLALLVDEFDRLAITARNWARDFFVASKEHQRVSGWLTREFTEAWAAAKPAARFGELLDVPELAGHRAAHGPDILQAIDLWTSDLSEHVSAWNRRFLAQEAQSLRSLFDNVERSPLTEEQIRAVVCFDNRVQLIAAAGSGKTSTMIAKAGYAVYRGIVAPDEILMLAFNAKAATELQQRITERLAPLGLAADRIVARTFHSFGLTVIGQATGRKPSLAPWVERAGGDLEKLAEIVDMLRDSDEKFRTEWDLFRMVFSRELPDFGEEENDPDGWDAAQRKEGFRTLQGEVVKSQGERMIADWLYYNGVTYEYERRYESDTADADHRQYQPDFYYPAIDVYHEHFALDESGEAPETFIGYLDGVAWKRQLHGERGTTLIETTMAQLWNGTAFAHLSEELNARGVELDPNPDRPVVGQQPIQNERLVSTFRSFMVHAKSNQLSDAALFERAGALTRRRTKFRQEMFLRLYQSIRDRWEEELRLIDCIDFEDMLNLAADHIETGHWQSPYRLVMVDEMQDASSARARLAKALVAEPGRYLFAVGDDWQSINRFAGADLSVMTQFERVFGEGAILRLERTFRCPQSICDVSSRFVAKNPLQLRKRVTSSTKEHPPTVLAFSAATEDQVDGVIRSHLAKLNDDIEAGSVPAGRGGRASVFILGRYRHQESLVPRSAAKQWKHLDVNFSTIHASKGLEADYVIIPGLTRDRAAFPSRAADDPVLRLAMPTGEPFPDAEERRLLYVALTRARRTVTLVTVRNRESKFLLELVKEHGVRLVTTGGIQATVIACPTCGDGTMVPRNGKFGPFYGCSSFPRCKRTMKEAEVESAMSG